MVAPDVFAITATSLAHPSKSKFAIVTAVALDNQKAQAFPIILGASGIDAKSQECCSGTRASLHADEKGKQLVHHTSTNAVTWPVSAASK
jgi:hypothetical protein